MSDLAHWELAQRLLKRTQDRTLKWEESGESFRTRIGSNLIYLRSTDDPEYPDDPDYHIQIRSTITSKVIEVISNKDLREFMDRKNSAGLNPYQVLRELYSLARRQALGVDEAISDLLKELE